MAFTPASIATIWKRRNDGGFGRLAPVDARLITRGAAAAQAARRARQGRLDAVERTPGRRRAAEAARPPDLDSRRQRGLTPVGIAFDQEDSRSRKYQRTGDQRHRRQRRDDEPKTAQRRLSSIRAAGHAKRGDALSDS